MNDLKRERESGRKRTINQYEKIRDEEKGRERKKKEKQRTIK